MKGKGEKVIARWNIRDIFDRPGQVRLKDDGVLEKKLCRERIWRALGKVDTSITTVKDIQESLKATEGIVKVTRQRG